MRCLLVGGDEGPDGGSADTSVDTRSVGLSAALTPRDKADKGLGGVDNRTSRVTLAGVLATSCETSTDHVGGDGVAGVDGLVLRSASRTINDWHADLEKVGGERVTALGSGAPGCELASFGLREANHDASLTIQQQ